MGSGSTFYKTAIVNNACMCTMMALGVRLPLSIFKLSKKLDEIDKCQISNLIIIYEQLTQEQRSSLLKNFISLIH